MRSDMPPTKNSGNSMQKDPYFCQSRKTTDYPSSLQQPFPKNYVPSVAATTGSPSARTTTSLVALVLVGVAVVVALLF